MSKGSWQEVPVEPRLVSYDAGTVVLGVGHRRIRALVAEGRVRAVAVGADRGGRGPSRYLLSLDDLNTVAQQALQSGRL